MTDSKYTRLSLSADEAALVLSLINQAEMGRSILLNTYGKISSGSMEEKLTTASHSLLARGYASISEKNVVSLNNEIEPVFYPLIKFRDILQVTLNTNQEGGPEIINVYFGKQKVFTALRIHLGVVYEFVHGSVDRLTSLISEWLDLPHTVLFHEELLKSDFKISMRTFAELSTDTLQQGLSKLQKAGFSKLIAETLMQDVLDPKKRGSVMLTNMTSDNYLKKNTDEGGAGFFVLVGKKSSWIFSFAKADDNTVAHVVPGESNNAMQQISQLVLSLHQLIS